jgi:hypothetical protein
MGGMGGPLWWRSMACMPAHGAGAAACSLLQVLGLLPNVLMVLG